MQQQNLDPFLAENFQVGAGLRRIETIRHQVVDLLLSLLHARHVVGKRLVLCRAIGMRGGETQQGGNLVAVGKVFGRPFLEYTAKGVPESLVGLAVLAQLLEQIEYTHGQCALDSLDLGILLQNFPGDVQ